MFHFTKRFGLLIHTVNNSFNFTLRYREQYILLINYIENEKTSILFGFPGFIYCNCFCESKTP